MSKRFKDFFQKGLKCIRKSRKLNDDPYILSKNVKALVNQGNITDAVVKIRSYSRNVLCTVAWNHIIDYCMNSGKVSLGLKYFNEMKKRAHFPNAQTFTILLHGFSKNIQYPKSVSHALYIYKSLCSSKYIDRLSIIHTNAILQVCALSKQPQIAFEIFWKISDNNLVADTITYTILFNIMSYKNMDMDISNLRKKMLKQVIESWKNKRFIVDESLVCSISRSFFRGKNFEDCDFIFTLIELFFGVKRLEPPLKRNKDIFGDDIDLSQSSLFSNNIRIGNKGLNIILLTCLLLKKEYLGVKYWDIIISNYDFVPDSNNCYNYFRLFLRTELKSNIDKKIDDIIQKYNNLNLDSVLFYMKACSKNKTFHDYIIAKIILKNSLQLKIKINIHIVDLFVEIATYIGSKNVILELFNILQKLNFESLTSLTNIKDKCERQNAILAKDRIYYNIIKYSKYFTENEYKYIQILKKL
ncbi:hypothetical protein PMAC_000594 [Pneumocystis sp. 'macacae']|nr:hypothetical protein PMAC_000594 [Pneumocystis sp. 'macacae']